MEFGRLPTPAALSGDRMSNEFGTTQEEDRVANEGSRSLSKEERIQVEQIRDLEAEFIAACRSIGASRDLSLAVTHMEDASMRAIRHITASGPKAPPSG